MKFNRDVTDKKAMRAAFDDVYDRNILRSGFFEIDSYYEIDRERYWLTLLHLDKLDIIHRGSIVEFGGGQMAILLKHLYGVETAVADISDSFRAPIDKAKIDFFIGNISQDPPIINAPRRFDVVLMLEVIEHLPLPPQVCFSNLRSILTKHGTVFLTTPNLFRLRNIFRMVVGTDIFDRFMLPQKGHGLGHQMEYSKAHMHWQFEQAGFSVETIIHDQLGQVGHSFKARLMRQLLSPLLINPVWREELVAVARL